MQACVRLMATFHRDNFSSVSEETDRGEERLSRKLVLSLDHPQGHLLLGTPPMSVLSCLQVGLWWGPQAADWEDEYVNKRGQGR